MGVSHGVQIHQRTGQFEECGSHSKHSTQRLYMENNISFGKKNQGLIIKRAHNQASQRTSVPTFEFCAYATLAKNSKVYTSAPAARRYKPKLESRNACKRRDV